ncbi:MAG: aminoglycoside phosphotransferase family protein [Betaproteobacteria bacterium]|nr:aminoglycoside phosphotransferase family protein [Betaproteobacteria bacterium]
MAALLAAQHPDLARLPLSLLDEGWDNAMFRLGEGLVVRLPRRAASVAMLDREQDWLPVLADSLPLPVPAPVRRGRPGAGYPWPWSVVPWIPGETADLAPPAPGEARVIGRFLTALHRPAPAGVPRNPVRGVPLSLRRENVEARAERIAAVSDALTPALLRLWEEALAVPIDEEDRWLHGDLHARNVLVSGGRIAGIIDWSDLGAGDRATDLASVWGLFESRAAREEAMGECAGVSEATWMRARGWAFAFGVMLLDSGLADHPRHAAMGRDTLRRLADGP